jgi:lipoprotein-anchoring transpeptidase ErfK/SrfK
VRVKKFLLAVTTIAATGLVLAACGSASGASSAGGASAGGTPPSSTDSGSSMSTTTPGSTADSAPGSTAPTTPQHQSSTPSKPPTSQQPQGLAPGTPCSAAAVACVDLSAHKAWLLHDGQVVYGPVSALAGKPSAPTNPGTYHVLYKDKDHKSKEFNDAPMPWSVFFDSNGSAFHTGSLKVKSNGCVHLADKDAAKFYSILQVGDMVQVAR